MGSAEAQGETQLAVSLIGKPPETRTFPPADSLGVLLDAFGEAIEDGTPFPVSTAEMLDTVAAFEAIIKSIESGGPVVVQAADQKL